MQTSKLMMSMLSAWAMIVTYEQLKAVTGTQIQALQYAGIITAVVSLYFGLYVNDKETAKGEA